MADTKQTEAQETQEQAQGTQTQETQQTETKPVAIDYDKIQKMLDGTLKAKEETALKAYFKQQGLSQEQVTQAIADFKAKQKTPDIKQIQADADNAKAELAQTKIEMKAMVMAGELGIDLKSVGYVLKLADLSEVIADGKVDDKKLKASIEKVLNDVPAFKAQAHAQNGFRPQVGVSNGGSTGGNQQAQQQKTTATKRWNRFNY